MAIAIGAVVFSASAAAATDCEGLAGKNFGDASITAANSIAPPFNIAGKDPPTPVSVNKPFCRVEGVLKPSADSYIKFEVWLPPESAWNGKYQGVGNGAWILEPSATELYVNRICTSLPRSLRIA